MAHTPGPWVNDKTHPEWERNVVWAGDTVIAHVVDDQHGNADVNARLIAATPDLLAALKAHLPWREEPVQGWGMWADAVAAIAKAEGKTDDQ